MATKDVSLDKMLNKALDLDGNVLSSWIIMVQLILEMQH